MMIVWSWQSVEGDGVLCYQTERWQQCHGSIERDQSVTAHTSRAASMGMVLMPGIEVDHVRLSGVAC